MTPLQDFLSLLLGAAALFLATDRAGFVFALVGGLVLAGACWWVCSFYSQLWNKRFKVRFIHHSLCACAALVTWIAVFLHVTLKHAETAAVISVKAWKLELDLDQLWAKSTFRTAYDRVRSLGLEKMEGSFFENLTSSIPTTHIESQIECAEIYAQEAAIHFGSRRPYLNSIVNLSSGISKEILGRDIQQHFASGETTYPTQRAIALVRDQIQQELDSKMDRVVIVFRTQLAVLFMSFQLTAFGCVGWAAYRDLKVTT